MALSQFSVALDRLVPSLIEAREVLTAVKDSTGDLTWATLDQANRALAQALMLRSRALDEAGKLPSARVSGILANIGVTSSATQFASRLSAIQTASDSYVSGLQQWIGTLQQSDLRTVVVVERNGVNVGEFRDVSFIPADRAAVLRSSTQLANLVAAFDVLDT